ncbi:MAG: hypothetical protein HZB55_22265 [Deltaproteobacteria bacterium]|nr:hypothetical protein [Deltaproteobacteria bacterium]
MPNPNAPPSDLRRLFSRLTVLLAAAVLSALVTAAFEPGALAQGSIIVDVDVLPKATTTGPLSVLRVELTFDNLLPRATVPLNGRLRARADIRYSGNGALTGRWLVDGRPLQTFNRTLTFGSNLVLETADLPPLPTFEPGYHDLTLQFSAPAVAFPPPVIRYFVEAAPGAAQIVLLQPLDGAVLTRPRHDGLFPAAAPPLQFAWRFTASFVPKGTHLRFSMFEPGQEATPAASALLTSTTYTMPPALAASLAAGREYLWQVQVLDPLGQLVATSESRRLTLRPASTIQLVNPAEDGAASLPQNLSWTTTRFFDRYQVRVYLNDAQLMADLGANIGSSKISGPGGTLQPTAKALFAAATRRPLDTLVNLGSEPPVPGLSLRWIVLGLDAGAYTLEDGGTVLEASEIGGFYLAPVVETVGGLPKTLSMAGFEIAVDAYEPGATLEDLSGSGTIRFAKDRSLTPIPVHFTGLRVEAAREQTRTVTGSGTGQHVIVHEVLTGRVLEGRIDETYAPALTLDLQGYGAQLGALVLQEGGTSGSGATADLTLVLPGYVDIAPRSLRPDLLTGELATGAVKGGASAVAPPALGPLYLPLSGIALEPGGDFYQEVLGVLVSGIRSTQPTSAGLTLLGGSLVADFSTLRDFVGANGGPVPREAGVFLMGGSAALAAGSLFPVTEPASVQLAFQSLELKPAGLEGAFEVVGSDAIAPVVPADYHVSFTAGSVALAAGILRTDTLTLDGNVELPASVRSASGMRPTAQFTQLRPNGAFLNSENINLPEVEWGPAGGTPFRLLDAGGQLLLPWGVITDAQRPGVTLRHRGTLDSPVRLIAGDIILGIVPQTESQSFTAGAATGGTGTPGSVATQQLGTAAGPGTTLDLSIRSGGVSGIFLSTLLHEGKLGDFAGIFSYVVLGFADSAVNQSSLAGDLVVPKPADFKLAFTEATATSTGEIVGPKIVVPTELALAYWRSKLLLPPVVGAAPRVGDGTLLATASASNGLAEGTATDAVPEELLLAAIKLDVPPAETTGGAAGPADPGGGTTLPPGFTGGPAESDNPPAGTTTGGRTAHPPAPVGITLSRSYLRISGASLRFVVDPQYGPPEFGDLSLETLDVGADGRIQGSNLYLLGTRFLGMDFLADQAGALVFSEYNGATAVPGAPLVTLDGTLTFPTLGDRHVTLAHTASGARADNLTPNGGVVDKGSFLKFEAANLVYHNFYAEGKGAYKEFFGKSQVIVLDTLHLAGIMMIGLDGEGVYEQVGLGVGVDPLKAATLYASGAVTIGAKLGTGGLTLATGRNSSAESEVANLLGSVAELGSAAPNARVEKLIKALTDALRLARRVRLDMGGSNEDSVGTALNLADIVVTLANGFTKNADRSEKPVVLAVADAVDLALGVIVNAKPGGQPLPQDARNGLNLGRLAVKGTRIAIQDGQIARTQWLDLTGQLLEAAGGFSTDRGYQLAINLLKGILDVGKTTQPNDPAAPLRVASRTFKVIHDSGLVSSPEAQDVLVLCQSLLEGLLAAKDMPLPQKAVAVASQMLDTASGPSTTLGGGPAAVEVKRQLKLAKRSLDLVGRMATGIPYDQAGKSVQATLHEAGASTEPAYLTVDTLVGSWVLVDSRPLDDTIGELQNLLACRGAAGSCTGSDLAGLVASAVSAIGIAQTANDLLAGLGRLLAVRDSADARGGRAEFDAALDSTRTQTVIAKAEAIEDGLLQQLDAATTIQDAAAANGRYLMIERALGELGFTGRGMDPFVAHVTAKATELMRHYVDEIDRAQDPWAATYWIRLALGIQRQAELFGFQLPDEADIGPPMARALNRFQDRARQAVLGSNTSQGLREAVIQYLGIERQKQLFLGMDENNPSAPELTLDAARTRYETLLQTELTKALQVGSAGLEPAYQAARQKLNLASRLEDADDAVALHRLFSLSATPVGYTPAQRDASRAELSSLLTAKGPALQSEALGRMKSANRGDLIDLANRYFLVLDVTGQGQSEFNTMVDGWIAQAAKKSCDGWSDLQDRLESPIFRYSFGKAPAIRAAVRDLDARCAVEGAGAQGPDPAQLYAGGEGSELDTLSKFLKDLPTRRRTGQPEAYLKEELAWHLAERVKGLTQFFKKGGTETQRVLGRVDEQTDFVLRYRRASTAERVIAAIQLMSEPLLAQDGIAPEIRAEIKRISDGLCEFAKLGGPVKTGVDLGIDLVFGLAKSHLPDGLAKGGVTLAYMGLQEARRPVAETRNSYFPVLLVGIAGAMVIEEVTRPLFAGPPPAIVEPATELLKMFNALREGTGSGVTPIARLESALAFLDKAAKLPVIGRYLSPLLNPVKHLVLPDTDQQDYFTNLLLAELVAARNDNPSNARIYFKSTCPSVSLDTGVTLPGATTLPNDLFVCAIDIAREAIGNHMKGAVDPLSPAGQAQRSQQLIAGMRQDAVFTRASGDDQLSGISGELLYRNGRFARFDFLATFGIVGQFESAAQITLDEPNRKLTLLQASYDDRNSGLLGQLGLGRPGMNRLFGSDYLQNPIKYLRVEVGGPNSCLDMEAAFGLTTPLGVWNTGRASVDLCFDPFAFDLGLTTRAGFWPVGTESRYHLFYARGIGGLDLGVTAGVYPEVLGVGAFLEGDAGVGLAVGPGGLEACGRFEFSAGYTLPSGGPSGCSTKYVPSNPNNPAGGGVCRTGASIGADARVGTDYRNFFVKAQGGVGLGPVLLGGWVYIANDVTDGAPFEWFPSNRYGGWSGVTSMNCGRP